MAKHPHRLMLMQKKTWRCTLPGCTYFIHRGLEYTLPGKQAVCWGCGEEFTVTEEALMEDQPKCADCRTGESSSGLTVRQRDALVSLKTKMLEAGVKKVDDLGRTRLGTMVALGAVKPEDIELMRKMESEPDEIEVIEPDEEN